MPHLESKHPKSISLPEGAQREGKERNVQRSRMWQAHRAGNSPEFLSFPHSVFIRHSNSRPSQTACGLSGGPGSHQGPIQTHFSFSLTCTLQSIQTAHQINPASSLKQAQLSEASCPCSGTSYRTFHYSCLLQIRDKKHDSLPTYTQHTHTWARACGCLGYIWRNASLGDLATAYLHNPRWYSPSCLGYTGVESYLCMQSVVNQTLLNSSCGNVCFTIAHLLVRIQNHSSPVSNSRSGWTLPRAAERGLNHRRCRGFQVFSFAPHWGAQHPSETFLPSRICPYPELTPHRAAFPMGSNSISTRN